MTYQIKSIIIEKERKKSFLEGFEEEKKELEKERKSNLFNVVEKFICRLVESRGINGYLENKACSDCQQLTLTPRMITNTNKTFLACAFCENTTPFKELSGS